MISIPSEVYKNFSDQFDDPASGKAILRLFIISDEELKDAQRPH